MLKATDAFRHDTLDSAYDRIARECAIPSYSKPRLREVLGGLVTSGALAGDLLEPLVRGLVEHGSIPSDLGKQLRKANKLVRDVLAGAEG